MKTHTLKINAKGELDSKTHPDVHVGDQFVADNKSTSSQTVYVYYAACNSAYSLDNPSTLFTSYSISLTASTQNQYVGTVQSSANLDNEGTYELTLSSTTPSGTPACSASGDDNVKVNVGSGGKEDD